jgi:gluconate 2-dehydrogenase gamma chain
MLEPAGQTTGQSQKGGVSRRDLLKSAGAVTVAFAVPAIAPTAAEPVEAAAPIAVAEPAATAAAALPVAFETLPASLFDVLESVVARLIPTDENGPGATEARAAHFLDRALGNSLVAFRDAYYSGLAALDAYAQSSKGAPFAKLSANAQDAVLTDMEKNVAVGFGGRSAAFFALLRTHTIQGMFCDPYHGGNANFVGWDLIGYPGVRLSATPEDQRMDVVSKPTRKSAYDFPMFTKDAKDGETHDH